MDVAAFLQALLDALAGHAFVESVDVQTEAIVARGRIQLEGGRFLQIYFNEETGTTAYALIEDDERIWGGDYDALRGGYEHPLGHPDRHRDIAPMTPLEVVELLAERWAQLS